MSDPRDYYVSLRRGEGDKAKFSLLAGPYATHAEALSMVTPARQEASRLDPWVDFDFIGTCSMPRRPTNKMGFLNVYLGVKPRELAAA